MTTSPNTSKTTTAFHAQAWISFALALLGFAWAILYLPVDPWIRGFLTMTGLFLVSSCFTLAKVVRDAQESQAVASRIDQARVDKILAEHDPFKSIA